MSRTFLAVVCVSIAELYLLVAVSARIGFFPTLGLCVLTGVIGGALVRLQGLLTLRKMRDALASGRLPADEILQGVMLIVAGVLLCVPGFLTDLVGFLVLLPPLRRAAAAMIRRKLAGRFTVTVWPPPPPAREEREIIDAEFEVRPDSEPPRRSD